jgi:HSP20 family protein
VVRLFSFRAAGAAATTEVMIVRFDPFHDIDTVARQILGAPAGTARAPRFMPMDMFKTADHYLINADLPGVDPGSIDVSVDNGVLSLRAHRSLPSDSGVQWITSERFAGSYMRQISLGEGVDADQISANYENGVLSVIIPMAQKAKPRRIEVGTAKSSAKAVSAPADRKKTATGN